MRKHLELNKSLREDTTFIDLLHPNSIEFMRHRQLAKRHRLYAPTNVLVSFRHQDTIAIFDWEAKRLLWTWGRGEISAQHDATVLENGNIFKIGHDAVEMVRPMNATVGLSRVCVDQNIQHVHAMLRQNAKTPSVKALGVGTFRNRVKPGRVVVPVATEQAE